ncbi:hypothetical protein C0Q70_12200 [Pomacea canaliculata]|uniref:Solute carrier organic anion transporter family member n=1 Tax=Pomacea canaliculata TaxID=400727 RepID=A0A2T7P0U7_POMCA|nr:hypothetical protein C0Q70_12200 [Pomacea canaliculata]
MAPHQKKSKPSTNDYIAASTDMDNDYVPECGIGGCKPPAARMLANIGVFTGSYCLCSLVTSTLNSYVNSQVTTLERHFGFTSSETGLIMAANDIGFLILVLFISYVADKIHIPRALGLATIFFGVSGIICALPHFLFGAPSPTVDIKTSNITGVVSSRSTKAFGGQLCDNDNLTSLGCGMIAEDATKSSAMLGGENKARAHATTALVIIVLGMVLQGVAKSPRYSFLTTYVDANVDRTKTGFYVGVMTTLGIMGPAMAYAIGGIFTRIYVTLEDTNLYPRHPKWIGAWWLGYITFGCAACVFGIPLFFFPRSLKKGKISSEKKPINDIVIQKKPGHSFSGFFGALGRLVTNPIYMLVLASSCALLFSVAGSQSFTPKYIENQFSFPAWRVNMSLAGNMLGTACVGTFVGGYLTKRLKMGPLLGLKFITAMQILSVFFSGLLMIFKCDQPYLYNSPGPRAAVDESTIGCNKNCACDDNDYFPICGDDGRTYFSPCHAGCLVDTNKMYQNCTCIAGGTATAGMCDYSCPMFYPFMVAVAAGSLFGTLSIIPKLIIYIRSVEERDKPLALGLASFSTSVTAWMLGPILFGKIVDGICIQWENSCFGRGACRLYDNDMFRLRMLGYQIGFRFLGLLLSISALVYAIVTKKFQKQEAKTPAMEMTV